MEKVRNRRYLGGMRLPTSTTSPFSMFGRVSVSKHMCSPALQTRERARGTAQYSTSNLQRGLQQRSDDDYDDNRVVVGTEAIQNERRLNTQSGSYFVTCVHHTHIVIRYHKNIPTPALALYLCREPRWPPGFWVREKSRASCWENRKTAGKREGEAVRRAP